jgi:hypothetical protein
MDIISTVQSVNIYAIAVAAIANMFIGSLWYSPALFGLIWMKEIGFNEDDLKKGFPMRIIFLLSFMFAISTAFVLAVFLGSESTTISGAITGAIIAVVFITTAKANNMLFEHQSVKLLFIHAGFDLVAYITTGAIVGGWH